MKILTADYVKSAPSLKECPDFEGVPEIVLVGRSNVGKSSFINSMTRRKNLARTSNTPGKTRYINFYTIRYAPESPVDSAALQTVSPSRAGSVEILARRVEPSGTTGEASKAGLSRERASGGGTAPQRPQQGEASKSMLFVDLPGYGYAKVSKTEQEQWRKNLEAYLLKRDPIRLVIQLIDARHGPQDNDIRMFEWLQHHGRPVQVVLTKSDKLSRNEASKELSKTARALDVDAADIIIYSAETHLGRDASWRVVQAAIGDEG